MIIVILVEFVINFIRSFCVCTARFFVWIITARDCKHCKYGMLNYWYTGEDYICLKADTETNRIDEYYKKVLECTGTITRKYFERKR